MSYLAHHRAALTRFMRENTRKNYIVMLFESASFTITGIQSYCMQQYGEQFHTSHKAGLYNCISLHEAHLEVSEGRAVELRDNMQCGANDKDQFKDVK